MKLEQGMIIELESGERYLYGENISYRVNPDKDSLMNTFWTHTKDDIDEDEMKIPNEERITKVWEAPYCEFSEINDCLVHRVPIWEAPKHTNKSSLQNGMIIEVTFKDEYAIEIGEPKAERFIVDGDGILRNDEDNDDILSSALPSFCCVEDIVERMGYMIEGIRVFDKDLKLIYNKKI